MMAADEPRDLTTVAFFGGLPRALGGGGLELHARFLGDALERRGFGVIHLESGDDSPFDVLHCLSTEPNVWHALRNWSRNRSPLVVTPTLVLNSRGARAIKTIGAIPLGISTTASMRRDVLREADAVLCLTKSEQRFCTRWLGLDPSKSAVIGNGTEAVLATETAAPKNPTIAMIGAITERKRQVEVLEALSDRTTAVVAGDFAGGAAYRRRFESALRKSGSIWLGHISDRAELWKIQQTATAVVLFSRAEGESLALLDSLALGTPVVVSDISAHRDLKERYPQQVFLVRRVDEIGRALSTIESTPSLPKASVPTWDEVAGLVGATYTRLIESQGPDR